MTGDPTKLKAVGATDLERRLLEAAAGEHPSPELSQRMRLGLGLAPLAPLPPAPSPVSVVAAKTGVAGWMAAGVVAAAVAGGVMVARLQAPSVPRSSVAAASAPAIVAAAASVADDDPIVASAGRRGARIERSRRRVVAPAPAVADIRGEIALVDAARTAVKSGEPERALALLHRYDTSFPGGSFRPEVAALRIESLAASGQIDLARARAREFIAAHPDSPLAARLARIAATPPG